MARFVTEQNPLSGDTPFTPDELAIVQRAVDRAVEEARMLSALLDLAEFSMSSEPAPPRGPDDIAVLEHFGHGPSADPREIVRDPLATVFDVWLDTPGAADQVQVVKDKYLAIARVLRSDDCLIGRVPDAADYDSVTAIVEDASGFSYGIYLGDPFFSDVGDTELHQIVDACRRASRSAMVLYRASILIHEAAHWVNHDQARGRRGHGTHGSQHDPYHYQQFLQEICCGRSRIQSYQGEIEVMLASRGSTVPAALGCHGGARRPGAVGLG